MTIVTDNAPHRTSFVEKLNPTNGQNEEESEFEVDNSTELNGEDVTFSVIKLGVALHMQCAVHTLQLAICNGLKEKQVKQLITKLHQVATIARTLKIAVILKRKSRGQSLTKLQGGGVHSI